MACVDGRTFSVTLDVRQILAAAARRIEKNAKATYMDGGVVIEQHAVKPGKRERKPIRLKRSAES